MSYRSYFQHDNRADARHVSFGRNPHDTWSYAKKYGPKFRKNRNPRFNMRDNDGDIEMGGTSEGPRYNPYKSRAEPKSRNVRRPRKQGPGNIRRVPPARGGSTWNRVMIPYGKKLGKIYIIRTLMSYCNVPIKPYSFQFHGQNARFFLNDNNAAHLVRLASNKITTPDGFKMKILVDQSSPPVTELSAEITEKIKQVMSSRYDVNTHHLNLSLFHEDSEFVQEGIYAPLSRLECFKAVINVIKENIPTLESLDLSNNRLDTLEPLTPLTKTCKNLKRLTLKNNALRNVGQLNNVKGMDIIELVLDGNPLCDNFKDQTSYISDVRERLPRVLKLDGQVLPPPIGFDLGTVESIPPSKGSFFPSDDVRDLIVKFIEQYYTIFDSENRQGLLEAYHDKALFSYCAAKIDTRGNTLLPYVYESRNLLKMRDVGERNKYLSQGKVNVVSKLSNLPRTQHDPNSFTVDVCCATPSLLYFVVGGVFKDVEEVSRSSLRTFTRTFIIVPNGTGYSITNDTWFITNATADQEKAFKAGTSALAPRPSPVAGGSNIAMDRKRMVVEFAMHTGMNEEYSAKCLEENGWDYQTAASVFAELNRLGSIPGEAFRR